MFKNVSIGQYIPGDTAIHRLDPRSKLIILFIYMASIFLVKELTSYLAVLFFMTFIYYVAEIPIKYVLRGLRPLLILISFTFLLNMFFTKGEVIYSLGPIDITKEGIRHAVFMALRLILLITGSAFLTLTTSPIDLTDGIESLLMPLGKIGFPAHEISMMMTIALRFIPTLTEEADKIMKAQMARGANFESGGLIKKAKALIPLMIPLFLSSFRRADELAIAMEARCYRGGEGRTKLNELKYKRLDYAYIAISLIYLALVYSLRYIK